MFWRGIDTTENKKDADRIKIVQLLDVREDEKVVISILGSEGREMMSVRRGDRGKRSMHEEP